MSENVAREWIRSGLHLVEAPIDPTAEQRAAHRKAWEIVQAEREAAAERDAKINERVSQFIEAGPGTTSEGPRGALLAHLGWLETARRHAAAATYRLETIAVSMARRGDAQAAISFLDEAVAASFATWVKFGSEGERPDNRLAERERLSAVVASTDADAAVAEAAEFEHAVAESVVEQLEGMVPALQCAILTESGMVIADRIYDLTAELREAYGQLCALALVTERGPTRFDCKLPPTPFGQVGFEISADDVPTTVSQWRIQLAALVADPMAEIVVPGTTTKPKRKSSLRSFLRSVT